MIMIQNNKTYLHFMMLLIYLDQNVNFISISFFIILFYFMLISIPIPFEQKYKEQNK